MKVVKTYCDVCGKESLSLFTIDADYLNVMEEYCKWKPNYGILTVDGVWEIELCRDCVKRAIACLSSLGETHD